MQKKQQSLDSENVNFKKKGGSTIQQAPNMLNKNMHQVSNTSTH